MSYVKWGFLALIVVLIAAFFHYHLPQRDVVRIVDTDVTRMDVGTDTDGNQITRDVRFIYTQYAEGGGMEYRNEDTGWGFPFYFKFDSAELANSAADAKSTGAEPRWVVLRHYGWRIPMLDMFPNALSMRAADGPDEGLIPWFNIFFIGLLVILILVLRRIVIILRKRHVDPVLEEIDQELDQTAGWWRRLWRRVFG